MSGEKRPTDHLEPAAKKRGSERQITKDDASDDEDQPVEAGTFARASEDVIKQRKIIRARRAGPPPAAAPAAAANPFANVQLASTGAAPAPAANPFAGITLQAPQPPAGEAAAPAAEEAKEAVAPPAEAEKKEEKPEKEPEEAKPAEKEEEKKPAAVLGGGGGFGGFAAAGGGFGAAAGGGFGGFASSGSGLAFGSAAPAAGAAAPAAASPSIFGAAAPAGTLLFGPGGTSAAPAPAAPAAADLPPAGPVQTGEEGEATVFSATARLYHFNPAASEWSVRGVGPLKVNTAADSGRARVVMRQRDTLKLLLNANLWSGMNLAPMEGAANSWRFTCFNHATAEGDAPPAASEAFAVRLGKEDSPVFEAVMKEHIPKKEGAAGEA